MFAKSRSWIRCVSLCVCVCVHSQLKLAEQLFIHNYMKEFHCLSSNNSVCVSDFSLISCISFFPAASASLCLYSSWDLAYLVVSPLAFPSFSFFLFEIYIVHTMSCTKCKSEETIKRKQLISCFCCCFLFQLICVQIRSLFEISYTKKQINRCKYCAISRWFISATFAYAHFTRQIK